MRKVAMEHIHVHPVSDLIEHNTGIVDDGYTCECNPEFKYDFDNNVCTVVHDAMDRRNLYE
jgi:hypothetical protein